MASWARASESHTDLPGWCENRKRFAPWRSVNTRVTGELHCLDLLEGLAHWLELFHERPTRLFQLYQVLGTVLSSDHHCGGLSECIPQLHLLLLRASQLRKSMRILCGPDSRAGV